jgi:alpha-beta hydrolase superfamily lysophospholipase
MKKEKINVGSIPAIIWGEKSDKTYIFVHGKMSNKESAETFAEIAAGHGYQTISFDLPEHGERTDRQYKCDIFNGIADLTQIGDYVFNKWKVVALFGCSLGAFFSLHAYNKRHFENCLFLSPVVNMEYLINQMFLWFNITEDQLREKNEIITPIDTMSWPYYSYVKEHPINYWTVPTNILYGGKDNLQSYEVINEFKNRFNCCLTVSANSEHPFMDKNDQVIVETWIKDSLL